MELFGLSCPIVVQPGPQACCGKFPGKFQEFARAAAGRTPKLENGLLRAAPINQGGKNTYRGWPVLVLWGPFAMVAPFWGLWGKWAGCRPLEAPKGPPGMHPRGQGCPRRGGPGPLPRHTQGQAHVAHKWCGGPRGPWWGGAVGVAMHTAFCQFGPENGLPIGGFPGNSSHPKHVLGGGLPAPKAPAPLGPSPMAHKWCGARHGACRWPAAVRLI